MNLGIQTYQISTNDYEVCIPSLSSILLAVRIKMPIGLDNWDVETYRNKFEFFLLCFRLTVVSVGPGVKTPGNDNADQYDVLHMETTKC